MINILSNRSISDYYNYLYYYDHHQERTLLAKRGAGCGQKVGFNFSRRDATLLTHPFGKTGGSGRKVTQHDLQRLDPKTGFGIGPLILFCLADGAKPGFL